VGGEYDVDDEVFSYCGYYGDDYIDCQKQGDEVRCRLHGLFVVGA